MSETKSHQFRPGLYRDKAGGAVDDSDRGATSDARREQQGWEAYRKWLSSMSGKPHGDRAPLDHSVYSWKGYHSWADRIRQSWKSEDKS